MTLFIDEPALESGSVSTLPGLRRFEDGEVSAYLVRGNEYRRVSDHELWAFDHDGLLVSARSGEPLAWRQGKLFLAIDTGLPLYYERMQ